jgi:hypothetical protein
MFYPNESSLDDEGKSLRPAWQSPPKIPLSAVLDRKVTCHCCKSVVQLLEDRLQNQDIISKSLPELAAADAMLHWGYRTEPACRPDHPDWELTRLEISLKLPQPVVGALRAKFGVRSFLDVLGPNVFVVLQHADYTVRTIEDSMEGNDDYKDEWKDPGIPAVEWGTGRSRPCIFDASVVNYWRDICEEEHGLHPNSPCREPAERVTGPFGILLPGYLVLRVIDVRQRCIVDLKPNLQGFQPRYYALSYVWGGYPFLTLNTANEVNLRKEGSLSQEMLPDTIADAMTVVTEMNGNYLWVDSLCILQDDDADKKRFISHMGTIYRQADMTIIGLCGDDAYAGLPGVRKYRPRMRQQEMKIKGTSVLPVMMLTGWAEAYKLGETRWTTRGWTHQETLLSRRRLVFGREQVHFVCGESIFSEDVIGPDFSPFIDTIARLQLFDSTLSALASIGNSSGQKRFQNLLTAFTRKQLSQRNDRLNAFMGILEEVEKVSGQFFQGIPLSCFSNAILWDRDFLWSGFSEVNEGSCQEESGLRIPGLPSWSWVGWMCDIRLAKDFDDEPVNGRLRFYGYTPGEGLMELETYQHKQSERQGWGSIKGEGSGSRPRGVLPKEFWDFEHTEVVLEDLPALDHRTPLLCFWTSTATIDLRAIGGKNCFKTRTGKTVSLGLRIFVPPGEAKRLELIVLGDQSYIQLDATATVAVIAIRWEGGIAYREPFGLETIAYSDWSEIERRCWKRIIMG